MDNLEFYKEFSNTLKYPVLSSALETMDFNERLDFEEEINAMFNAVYESGQDASEYDFDSGYNDGYDKATEAVFGVIGDIDWLAKSEIIKLAKLISDNLDR